MVGGRKDVSFTLKTDVSERCEVKMQLNFTNNSPNDYWVASDAIFRDGFKEPLFGIYGGPSEIRCGQETGKHLGSDIMLVKSESTAIGPVLLLSDICSFEEAEPGEYILRMHIYQTLYTNEIYEAHKNGYTPLEHAEYYFNTIESTIIIGDCREESSREHK